MASASRDVAYPAQEVNIRSTSAHFYTLAEKESGVVLETMDEGSAFFHWHPGAVYLHQGDPYLITDLDLESHTAYAVMTEVPCYTDVRDLTETRVLNVYRQKSSGSATVCLGRGLGHDVDSRLLAQGPPYGRCPGRGARQPATEELQDYGPLVRRAKRHPGV